MFLSTYMMKMDKKGRVSVPASWRPHLSAEGFDGFIAFPSIGHDAIDARGIKAFEGLMEKLRADTQARGGTVEAELFTGSDNEAAHLASIAVDVVFDRDGRLQLPPPLKSIVGDCEQLAFVGRHGFFQIWSDHAWERQSQVEREAFRGRMLARRGGTA
jgi:MraZ protein